MAKGVRREFRQDLLAWAEDNLRDFSWRDSDRSSYEIFVAEMLLTRTRASMVADVYDEFLNRYPSFNELADAEPVEVADLIAGLGLHNRRGQALVGIAANIGEEGLPDDSGLLQEFPYVGPYVANATRCFGFEEPCPIIDSNVQRIYSRLFGETRFGKSNGGIKGNLAEEMLPED